MNRKFFIPALIAAVFAASAPALAQNRDRDGNWQQRAQEPVRERGGDAGRWQADRRDDDGRRGDYRRDDDDRRADYRRDDDGRRADYRRDGRRDGWRDDDRRGDNRRGYDGRHDGRRYVGAGPNHDLRRGARLPSRYHHRHYVVDNWRSHRLSAPPRGYHWVQTGDDYVLAAIATGIIAQIILNN